MRDVTEYNKKTGESADEETRPANRQIDEHVMDAVLAAIDEFIVK